MSLTRLLDVSVRGPAGAPALVLLHGFGCGREMWRYVAPSFEADHRVVLLDLPGSGRADPASYDPARHRSLSGYADDVAGVLDELGLDDVVLVGHSVSAMIAVLVHLDRPGLVGRLVLVTPSARYLDDEDYTGGFSAADIDELLDLMSRNHLGWQDPLAAMVAGPGDGATATELAASFCRMRPEIAAEFAEVTFRADNRDDLPAVAVPTLVVQSEHDDIAPMSAGRFVHEAIAGSRFEVVATRGHCPHLSAPEATTAAIRGFLDETARG